MVFVNGQIPVFIAYWICTVIYARTLSGDINILYYVNYINIILHTKKWVYIPPYKLNNRFITCIYYI